MTSDIPTEVPFIEFRRPSSVTFELGLDGRVNLGFAEEEVFRHPDGRILQLPVPGIQFELDPAVNGQYPVQIRDAQVGALTGETVTVGRLLQIVLSLYEQLAKARDADLAESEANQIQPEPPEPALILPDQAEAA